MGVYVHERNWASKRGFVFIAVVGLHGLLIWGLANGFAVKIVETLSPPIIAEIVNEKRDEALPPPPPPPPKMELPPVEVPPPVVNISLPLETNTALSNVTDRPVPPSSFVAGPPVLRTAIKQNPRAPQPNLDDYYPPASKRLGEEGVTRVKVCVSATGRVENASLEESSGIPRLDEAAVRVAKAYGLLPPTENGKAVPGCSSLPIRFKLTGEAGRPG